MKELYIFCGLPFSGKSTLARVLSDTTNTPVISYDTVRRQEELAVDPSISADKELMWDHVRQVSKLHVEDALSGGESVIYDGVNPTRQYRDELRISAYRHKAAPILIYLNTSLAVIHERIRANELNPQRPGVQPTNFEKIRTIFEVPTLDEHPIAFAPSDDIIEWMQELRQKKQVIYDRLSL